MLQTVEIVGCRQRSDAPMPGCLQSKYTDLFDVQQNRKYFSQRQIILQWRKIEERSSFA
jgi:hypothetical protein